MRDIASTIKEREQAFEAQYKLGEEQNFKIRARRDRLFGEWIAEKIGLRGEAAEHYAIKVAQLDLEMPGDDNLLEKIEADLEDAGKDVPHDTLLLALSISQETAQRSYQNQYPEALDTDHHV